MPGALRISRYPFAEEIIELQTHSKAITKIRVTFDDSFLFTVGEDGVLIIYQINDKVKVYKNRAIQKEIKRA
jgi:hypothetical protein